MNNKLKEIQNEFIWNGGVPPIYKDERGWWFWNEHWDESHGPYLTEEETKIEMEKYADTL